MTCFNLYMHILPTLYWKIKHSLYHVVYLFILQMTFFYMCFDLSAFFIRLKD